MRLFNKKKKISVIDKMQNAKTNSFGEDLTHLDSDGNLPFGWLAYNSEFTKKINSEHLYFHNIWCESKRKGIKDEYSALKSYIVYLHDVQKLCVSKGECFEEWFRFAIANDEYIDDLENQLSEIKSKLRRN